MKYLISIACAGAILTGCGANPVKQYSEMPDWISAPVEQNGIAASSCVMSSSDFSIDRSMAVTSAKSLLVEQIKARTEAVSKLDATRSSNGETVANEQTFTKKVEVIASQWVTGARSKEFAEPVLRGKPHTCALVVLPEKETKELFRKLMESKGSYFTENDEKYMFDQFIADSLGEKFQSN